MMSEPRIRYETSSPREMPRESRAVKLIVSVEWAQALTRLQQLHQQGCRQVRLVEDDRGRVRVEPGS